MAPPPLIVLVTSVLALPPLSHCSCPFLAPSPLIVLVASFFLSATHCSCHFSPGSSATHCSCHFLAPPPLINCSCHFLAPPAYSSFLSLPGSSATHCSCRFWLLRLPLIVLVASWFLRHLVASWLLRDSLFSKTPASVSACRPFLPRCDCHCVIFSCPTAFNVTACSWGRTACRVAPKCNTESNWVRSWGGGGSRPCKRPAVWVHVMSAEDCVLLPIVSLPLSRWPQRIVYCYP